MTLLFIAALMQDNAEELFKKFEKKFIEARSVSVRLEGEVSTEKTELEFFERFSVSGAIRFKTGDKWSFDLAMVENNQPEAVVTARSDGSRTVTVLGRERLDRTSLPGYSKFLAGGLTRWGLAVTLRMWNRTHEGEKAPEPDEFMKMSDLKPGGRETVGGKEAVVLEYTLTRDGVPCRVKLWLEGRSLLPIRRTFAFDTGSEKVLATETYSQISIDEIPDSEFSFDDKAEELFKRFEKQIGKAPSLSARFKGETGKVGKKVSYSGAIRVKSGNRYRIEIESDGPWLKGRSVSTSDGTRVVGVRDGQRTDSPTEEGLSDYLPLVVTRTGFMDFTFALYFASDERKKAPNLHEFLAVEKFKMGPKEKVGLVEAIVIEYTLRISREEFRMKLWLDPNSLAPLQRSLTQDGMTIVETYEDVSTVEIPDKEFEHK